MPQLELRTDETHVKTRLPKAHNECVLKCTCSVLVHHERMDHKHLSKMVSRSRNPAFTPGDLQLLAEQICFRQELLFPGSSHWQDLRKVRRAWQCITRRYNKVSDYPREVSEWGPVTQIQDCNTIGCTYISHTYQTHTTR